jgi:hypothetical protein
MFDLSEPVLLAMQDELHKEAALADRLKNIGSLGGVGSMLGAGGGALLGGVRGYNRTPEEGGGGVGGAVSGAMRGGLLGGAVGGLGGGVAGSLAKKDFSHLAQGEGALASASRFGQRQVHGFTGMLTPSEVEGVHGGAYAAKQNLQAATKARQTAADDVFQGPAAPPGRLRQAGERAGLLKPQTPEGRLAARTKDEGRATKAHAASQKAQEMGLTSIPGYLKSMKNNGVLNTLGASAEEQIRTQPLVTGMAAGIPLAAGVLAKPEEGKGRGEAVGSAVGGAIGGVAGGMLPLGGQLASGAAASQIGSWAGRGVDRLRGRRLHNAPTPTMEPTDAQHIPTERNLSPAAAGQAPESPV